jgi:hypothetical protein
MQKEIKKKITSWFPKKINRFEKIYEILQDKHCSDEISNCLMKGLRNDIISNRKQAAKSLSVIVKGDERVKDKLIKIILSNSGIDLKVSAFYALYNGWNYDEEINRIIKKFEWLSNPTLNILAICAKIKYGIQQKEDKEKLLQIIPKQDYLSYLWQDEIIDALSLGWKKDEDIKKFCKESFFEENHYQALIPNRISVPVLAKQYLDDEEIFDRFEIFFNDRSLPINFGFEILEIFLNSFEKEEGLKNKTISILESWFKIFEKNKYFDSLIPRVVKILPEEVAEQNFCKLLKKRNFDVYLLSLYVNNWEIDNIAEVIKNKTENKTAEILANFIMRDTDIQKEKLHELFELIVSSNKLIDVLKVLRGVNGIKLIDIYPYIEMRKKDGDKREKIWLNRFLLYTFSDEEPLIRKLAIECADKLENYVDILTESYYNIDEIREKILESLSVVNEEIRSYIVNYYDSISAVDEFGLTLFKNNHSEISSFLKDKIAYLYYSAINNSSEVDTKDVELLKQDLFTTGFHFEETRVSAFIGLCMLKRYDVLKEAFEDNSEDNDYGFGIFKSIGDNISVVKTIMKNRKDLEKTFGKYFYKKISFGNDTSHTFWVNISMLNDIPEGFKKDLLTYIESCNSSNIIYGNKEFLVYMEKHYPRSEKLKNYCMRILTESQVLRRYGDMEQYILASEILRRNFNDDSTLTQILHEIKVDSICWYLYNGFENNPKFVSLQKKHKVDSIKNKAQLFPVYVSLLDDREFVERVRSYFQTSAKGRKLYLPYWRYNLG